MTSTLSSAPGASGNVHSSSCSIADSTVYVLEANPRASRTVPFASKAIGINLVEAACKLAVYLHGSSGDLAEADEGDIALLPTDIADRLGDAVLELTARRRVKRQADS